MDLLKCNWGKIVLCNLYHHNFDGFNYIILELVSGKSTSNLITAFNVRLLMKHWNSNESHNVLEVLGDQRVHVYKYLHMPPKN